MTKARELSELADGLTVSGGNVDITGTVTADGLTVDTNTLHVDSTNNRVGIGTSSPSGKLHVSGGRSYLQTSSGDQYVLKLTNPANADGVWLGTPAADSFAVYNAAGAERMRIDSSGRLLQGATSVNMGIGNTNTGSQLSDYIVASRTAGAADQAAAYFNKNSLDGDIVQFRKDGTSVGSIGTQSGLMYLGSGDTGIRFYETSDFIMPVNPASAGVARDAAISIGGSTTRFKDLYLSGGVYLGGTGSANLLDDYETGTFTLTLGTNGFSQSHSSFSDGRYTKIGRTVHVQFRVFLTASGYPSGYSQYGGLPFTVNDVSVDGRYGSGAIAGGGSGGGIYATGTGVYLYPTTGTTASGAWSSLWHVSFSYKTN